MRILKLIGRAVFSAHFITLLFLAVLAHNVLGLVGTTRTPSIRTLDDALVLIAFFTVLVVLGWLSGNEVRAANVRRLTRERDAALAHGAYLRGLNAGMIDDVMAAARAGVKVKSLVYTFAGQDAQEEWAAHAKANTQLSPEAKAALFEAAGLSAQREAREFDYGGRL